ncbi:MAG: CapA family protein [Bernardetiaceae bacterium]
MQHQSRFFYTFIFICACTLSTLAQNVRIIGVGDIMMGTNYPSASYLPPNDGKDLLAPVVEILKAADVTFGNLEGTVLNEGGNVKKCSNPDACYAFRMPEKYVDNLLTAGFDLVSIANNHVGDFGEPGRKNTVAYLQRVGLAAAGLLSQPTAIIERNGLKFGLAAFAPNSGTVDIRNLNEAKTIVRELAKTVDIVIVSFHGGAEGRNHQHVPCKTEIYYGENRGNVCAFAEAVIDAGADVVFGHGPHVTRAINLYKGRFIAYSLGNFCTYARFSLTGESGLAPIISVETDREGKFVQAQITSIFQEKPGGVQLDPQKRVVKIIQKLTKDDFPDAPLKITDEGLILQK